MRVLFLYSSIPQMTGQMFNVQLSTKLIQNTHPVPELFYLEQAGWANHPWEINFWDATKRKKIARLFL
jgi:hypothetical protein